ncbi:TonB-dependent receptor [Sphingoaurantiacus capsulatus]|uniref:TonB-dependent receptor n=1 Tax=Sphingoaurantiacus capsulatus TaxID=1771310 RepID=A0ABV7XH73_9SPHN
MTILHARASVRLLAGTALLALHLPLAAQEAAEAAAAPAAEGETYTDEEIVVVGGARLPGAVIGDIPPENTLDPRDIRATGATSIAELLEAVAPQTASSRSREGGQPIVLLNGRRTSGFREVRDLPPEAILRMDILPEEVALKYGYRADQRVVNIVLRPRFRSTVTRVEGEMPTEGGRFEGEADATRLMINEDGRTTINLRLEGTSSLTESERDIAPPAAGERDQRDFRTLLGSRQMARLGGTVNRTVFGDVAATFDGQVESTDGRSLLGESLLSPGTALERNTDNDSGRLGMALNTDRGSWRLSATGSYELSRSLTLTDRETVGVASRDRARSTNSTGALDVVASGPLAELPAGRASMTVKVAGDTRDIDSRAQRVSGVTETDLGRDRLSSSLNFDLPVAKRNGAWGAIGTLTLNGNVEVEELSDFGTLVTAGGGLFWAPVQRLSLIASYTREQGAPGLQQLGDPVLVTPNSRIFDFRLGETVLVDQVSGGNPDLLSDTRKVTKLGATLKPLDETNLELRGDYVRTRTDDPLSRFPGPTAAIEAAFPERFTRNAAGDLIRVDLRPVNYDSSARDEVRWGINFSKPLKSAQPSQSVMDQLRRTREAAGGGPQPQGQGAGQGQRGPGGFRGPGGGPGGFGPFGGGQSGRLTLSAYHTLLIRDEVLIRPGLPVIDYLDGEAADTGGGRARHRVEVESGWFNNGIGVRLTGTWQSGSQVVGGPSGDLDFAPLTKMDLRIFANLGEKPELVLQHPWLRGTQVRLGVDNLFDAKQKVRDGTGLTPINYQPDLLDAQGRTVSISFRKLFLPPRSAMRRPPPPTPAPAAPTS